MRNKHSTQYTESVYQLQRKLKFRLKIEEATTGVSQSIEHNQCNFIKHLSKTKRKEKKYNLRSRFTDSEFSDKIPDEKQTTEENHTLNIVVP